jgi:hypothetical protein
MDEIETGRWCFSCNDNLENGMCRCEQCHILCYGVNGLCGDCIEGTFERCGLCNDSECPLIDGVCADCAVAVLDYNHPNNDDNTNHINLLIENNIMQFDPSQQCNRCGDPEEETSGLEMYHGFEYCEKCINIKMKKDYEPILITHKECDGSFKDCCVCLESKQCMNGIFDCKHKELCTECYLNLNKTVCPLCRADEKEPTMHPISELIERFRKYHCRYPWNMRKTNLNGYSQPAFFQYWAFKWIRNDKNIDSDDDDDE